jgi:carbon monoxide dehydrogenase subunit G
MRFEKSIDIDAPQQRVWDVVSALDAWPQRIETMTREAEGMKRAAESA